MKNNYYETVVIINAALEDEQIQPIISLTKDTILNHGGEIIDTEDWGRKRLAYPIQKSKSGYYFVFRFISETRLIDKLERMFQINESIIRYLTVKLNKNDLEHYKSLEIKKTEEAENKETAAAPVENNSSLKNESNV